MMRWIVEARGQGRGKNAFWLLAMVLLLALSVQGRAVAQNDSECRAESYRTFNLSSVSPGNDPREISDALRNMLDPSVKIYFVPSTSTLIVRANADQMAIAEKLLAALDRPRKSYRLTYTMTDLDGEKRLGVQHFSMIVVSGGRTQVKDGSKVPVATGSYSATNTNVQTQFTYLDVGLNFDASLEESVNGVRLRAKVERSSVAEAKDLGAVHEPVIRQMVLEGTSMMTPGKPLVLGTLDLPDSPRQLEVQVMLEQVR